MGRVPAVDPTKPPTAVEKAMRKFVMSKPGTAFAMKVSTRIDPVLLKLTGGRFSTGMGFPIVLLTVAGRKSGLERTVPLVYFTQEDEVILVAVAPSYEIRVRTYERLAGEFGLEKRG